ncbi:hypothetical protein NPIL_545951 [Nephila pilipes]|uniref:Uncharacterized protein n=1 Tax=Nephila pilipes TaxID=299642 RepID=A0A8X6N7H7_NEPPI|nr:hypothetical protein NPIL_545951 [Nephila pilipes]
MFKHLCTKTEELDTGIVENLREEVKCHLQNLESEIQRYFPELPEQEVPFVPNPFHVSLDVTNILHEIQDEFSELRNDSSVCGLFQEKSLFQFWCIMRHPYLKISTLSFQILVYEFQLASAEADFQLFCKSSQKSGISWLIKIT